MTTKHKKDQKKKANVRLERKIDSQSERYSLFRLYKHCYESKNEIAAEDQSCYDYQEFIKALKDREYLKFILNNEDGLPIGLILAVENLKKAQVAYINPELYRSWLESHPQNEGILYTTFLGIDPDHRSQKSFYKLVGAMIRFCIRNDLHAGLDFSGTVSNLPKGIKRIVDSLYRRDEIDRSASYERLDYQEFGVFELDPEK